MTATKPKIQTLIRAQTALLRIELRRLTTQLSFLALALVVGLLGLGMLNVGAFLGLSQLVAPAWSALILAVLDALLAAILIQFAGKVQPGPEAEIAKEVRDILLDELSADAQSVRDEIGQVRADVQRIRSGFSAFSSGVPALGSLVELLTRTVGRSKKKG